jgi:16S rRNA (cytidine1402-2'-O)-methyltransferase
MLAAVSGKLIICGTPIGNLSDVPDRLRLALGDADLVYAEDTRRAATLLRALGIRAEVRSYFVGNEDRRAVELAERLRAGDVVALVSDAGMPSIADPGFTAVNAAIGVGAEVTVVPGPSAVTAALAVSGLPADRFVFEAFLPRRSKDRRNRLGQLADEERTIVLFAGKAHVVADLGDLAESLGGDRRACVARELTKVYEEVWRGTLADAVSHWAGRELRGEFTIVIAGADAKLADFDRTVADAIDAIESGESMADAVRRIASESGISRRQLYEAVLKQLR